MAIFLKDPEVDRLARELAEIEGTSITDAISRALAERRARLLDAREAKRRRADAVLARLDALPVLDPRDHAEMLYGEDGLPR
jgi:antitoxin VapB